MPEALESTGDYRFGDLLALARQGWVQEMAARLGELGHRDYRRSDALAMRALRREQRTITELGTLFGISRQAARKIVDGLRSRGLVSELRDPQDGRRINIQLTEAGRAYAEDIVEVITALNRELVDRVPVELLRAADAVLRLSMTDPALRRRADRTVARPPGARDA